MQFQKAELGKHNLEPGRTSSLCYNQTQLYEINLEKEIILCKQLVWCWACSYISMTQLDILMTFSGLNSYKALARLCTHCILLVRAGGTPAWMCHVLLDGIHICGDYSPTGWRNKVYIYSITEQFGLEVKMTFKDHLVQLLLQRAGTSSERSDCLTFSVSRDGDIYQF